MTLFQYCAWKQYALQIFIPILAKTCLNFACCCGEPMRVSEQRASTPLDGERGALQDVFNNYYVHFVN